jgi:hypothetical protein
MDGYRPVVPPIGKRARQHLKQTAPLRSCDPGRDLADKDGDYLSSPNRATSIFKNGRQRAAACV